MSKRTKSFETIWMKDVGDKQDSCWVPCNKIDRGAVEFIRRSQVDEVLKSVTDQLDFYSFDEKTQEEVRGLMS